MTPLRQKMLDAMILRGYSERTKESYIYAVKQLAAYFRRSPDQLNDEQIKQYFLYLLKERKLSPASCRLYLNGIIFFYRCVLERQYIDVNLPLPKKPQRIPELLSKSEVIRILNASKNDKQYAMLATCYACGLRVSEVVALQLHHIDTERGVVRIEQGKGRKDRNVLLTENLKNLLQRYCHAHRPQSWLFFGVHRDRPFNVTTAKKAFLNAKRKAGIKKNGGIHSLRHAYATHQLEAGVAVHQLQQLMGHKDIHTTLRYVHWNPSLPQSHGVDLLTGVLS